ncbi:hypothetical protein ABMA28_007836 [Loxostege sticticalis]|uniref:Sodium channel protein Nach n=1 Tax=Loxostege sticticalis TaxID=481309 RepID=A0ABD0SL67_LOXSC
MKGNFKTLFKRFCLEGSISVMKYFYLYPDRLSRCFWSVIMVAMFVLALFLTYQLYMRFDDMPTRITIENQYEPVRALPYPAITVCSPNQITISAVSHFNKTLVDGNATSNLDHIVSQMLGFYEPVLYFNKSQANLLQSLIDLNRYTISEVLSLLPQPCEDFLQVCILGRVRYPNCKGIFSPVLTTHGLCCAFNSKYHYSKYNKRNEVKPHFVSRMVSASSSTNAFTMVVDYRPADAVNATVLNAGGIRVKPNFVSRMVSASSSTNAFMMVDYRPADAVNATVLNAGGIQVKPYFVSRMVSASSSTNAFTMVVDYRPADAVNATVLNAGGIRVMFNDHTEFPADDVSNLVLANSETFHIIHATHTYCSEDVKLLPVTSRKCYLPHERSLRFFHDYHNSDCDHLCLVEMVKQECSCDLFFVPFHRGTNVCNVSCIECITSAKLNQHKLQPSLADCTCLRDCESRRYAVEVSTGNLRALPYMFKDIYSGITFNRSTAIMHFFFSKSVYVKQKQETVISVITLVSNLGGVFGLCVGCSAMSVVEIIFYLHTAFKNYIRIQIRRRNGRVVSLK